MRIDKTPELSQNKWAFMVWVLATLFISFCIIADIRIPVIDTVELKSRDIRFLLRGERPAGGHVVIASIDEKSIKKIGRYPWPRYVLAEIIRVLAESGARVICVDLLFTEPQENPEWTRIQHLISTYTKLGLLTDDSAHQAFYDEMAEASETADHDAYLAQTLQRADAVILAMMVGSQENGQNGKRLTPLNPERIDAVIYPIDSLNQAAAGVGFVNIIHDIDGSVRQAYPALMYNQQLLVSLPVKAAQRFLFLEDSSLKLETNEFRMKDRVIPLTKDNKMFINYYGDVQLIHHISASDILIGDFPQGIFQDKCVFIGGAATGLGDHWANPFSGSFWGVELQATIADNILSSRFLKRPDWIKYCDSLIVAIFGLLAAVFSLRLSIKKSIVVPFICLFVCSAMIQFFFQFKGIILLWIYPSLEIVTICVCIFLRRYLGEEREKKFIKSAFQQYLHPAVVERIIEHPERLILGGEMKELTVMFSDIRDFTALSEKMAPQDLVKFINRYFSLMTDIIQSNYGTVDKYIGDAVMAIFGAPEDQQDHALRACQSALIMTEELHTNRQRWVAEGFPEIRIGIGINTGDMIVGNMGSEKRFSYTVMGDHVNQASRLENISKLYGVKIVVSESVWEKTKNQLTFRELDYIRVKGKSEPVKIFELLGKDYHTGGKFEFITTFETGLKEYRQQNWDEAIFWFKKTLTHKKNDLSSNMFIDRCCSLKTNPPKDNWNGIFDVQKK